MSNSVARALPRSFVVAALAGLIAACSSSTGPVDLEQLDAAQARWAQRSFADYSYEARIICFCTPEVLNRVRVEVRGDQIATVTDVATDQPVPRAFWDSWRTIDDLFARIRLGPLSSNTVRIDAVYDADLGFPRDIDFVADEGVADGGWSHIIFDLTPLEAS